MVLDPAWLSGWLVRVGAPHLYANLGLVLSSAGFFLAVQVASAYWFPKLLPKQFAKLSPATRADWDLHFVSPPIHSLSPPDPFPSSSDRRARRGI